MFPSQAVFGELGLLFSPLWRPESAANLGIGFRLRAHLQLTGSQLGVGKQGKDVQGEPAVPAPSPTSPCSPLL